MSRKITSYAEKLFGSVFEAKRLFVEELRMALESSDLSPEELDEMLGLSCDWPRVSEILENPNLFTKSFQQILELKSCVLRLTGKLHDEKISMYLSEKAAIDRTVAELQSTAMIMVHVSLDQGDDVEKLLASRYILTCLLEEIGDAIE